MNVITNNQPRDIIEGYQLTQAERAEFDYLDWNAIEAGNDSAQFVRYKGQLLDLAEFTRWDNPMSPTRGEWDEILTDTFFSGYVVRYHGEYYEQIVVGRYYV